MDGLLDSFRGLCLLLTGLLGLVCLDKLVGLMGAVVRRLSHEVLRAERPDHSLVLRVVGAVNGLGASTTNRSLLPLHENLDLFDV